VKRKLLLLNLILAGLLVWIGFRFRDVYAAARTREARVLGRQVPRTKFPPLPVVPPPEPVTAATYLDVASRMLFAKDRNPNVIIDPVPVEKKPEMPALPVAHGLMLFGDPGIILSERPGAAQRTYHKGEKVGPFKVVSFDTSKIVLDWNGELVERTVDELLEKSTAPPEATVAGAAKPAAPPAAASVESHPLGPGADIGAGFRGCQPNDSSPSGTVQGGYRKIEVPTPFGKSCRWEPVR
jgi:hypothetical protein